LASAVISARPTRKQNIANGLLPDEHADSHTMMKNMVQAVAYIDMQQEALGPFA